mgnify:CR=1 FL=1
MNDLFSPALDLVNLAHRLSNHPSRLVLWNEGSVATQLPKGRLAVSQANAHLGKLCVSELAEFETARVRALTDRESFTEEDLEEARSTEAGAPVGVKPSSDLFLYADLFTDESLRFAAHTQPVAINQILCSPRARQFADRRNLPHEVLVGGPASMLVPFAPPGVPLARELRRRLTLWYDRYKIPPKVILIQNHGMIALGASADEVVMLTEMTVKFAEIFLGAAMMGGPEFLKPAFVAQIEAEGVV